LPLHRAVVWNLPRGGFGFPELSTDHSREYETTMRINHHGDVNPDRLKGFSGCFGGLPAASRAKLLTSLPARLGFISSTSYLFLEFLLDYFGSPSHHAEDAPIAPEILGPVVGDGRADLVGVVIALRPHADLDSCSRPSDLRCSICAAQVTPRKSRDRDIIGAPLPGRPLQMLMVLVMRSDTVTGCRQASQCRSHRSRSTYRKWTCRPWISGRRPSIATAFSDKPKPEGSRRAFVARLVLIGQ